MAEKKRGRGNPSGLTTWNDEHYVTAYQLARSGASLASIAKGLGTTEQTFELWRKRRPALQSAVDRGRKVKKEGWRPYVFRRLSTTAEEAWADIMACEEDGVDVVARIEAILEDNGEHVRQELFLHALVEFNFNASEACRAVNISYGVLQRWKQNPAFVGLLEEMKWHLGNYFEGGLVNAVGAGNTKAIIFANQTFNKDRGYNAKLEVEHKGQVNHVHAVIDVDALDLPLEVRTAILEAVRKQKQLKEQAPLEAEVVGSNGNGRGLTWEDG